MFLQSDADRIDRAMPITVGHHRHPEALFNASAISSSG